MIGVGADIITQGRFTTSGTYKYKSVKYIVLLPLTFHYTSGELFKKIASDMIQIVYIFPIIRQILFVLYLLYLIFS
jgi:hypothetical protein